MQDKYWFKKSYRRNLVDMHIEDWDEQFLSKFDPETYVDMLKLGNVKSAMIYANSHVGHCYWPTKTGHMHRGIKGRDVLGETFDLCHKAGIEVILYYSLIFNNWAHKKHPEWRVVGIDGEDSRITRLGRASRYGVCCPNSPRYRKFVLAQIDEFCYNYDFEGVFFDMTFWPIVCYCPDCKKRYKEETSEELPETIDWNAPSWIKFQKKREQWIAEFAGLVTDAVKKHKPDVAVQHNSATVPLSWTLGVSELVTNHYDYCSGDFYGGVLQQSFICKLYYNLTPNMPFEYMTSFCYPGLNDHTATKPKELIECRGFLTIAHAGAFLVIDAIDPVGTLHERRYKILGDVFRKIQKYEKYLEGNLCQDVAIYFSFNSKMNFADNGKRPSQRTFERLSQKLPHLEAALGAAEALKSNHIPFGVVTKRNLATLSRYQILIVPNVLRLEDDEAEAIINYVNNGGSFYASKFSLKSKLSEALGIISLEETKENSTYISPTVKGKTLMPEINRLYPLSIRDSQFKANLSSRKEIIAKVTLPYTNPADITKFASIHSNPPGIYTNYPAIVYEKLGKGKVIWSSASIETQAVESLRHRSIFVNLVRKLAQEPFSFEAEAPACVEVTLFHNKEKKRYLINLVNFQSEIGMPNLPVNDVVLKVKVKSKPVKVSLLPDEILMKYIRNGEYVKIILPTLQTFQMIALDYE